MPSQGGFLILFDEVQRTELLREVQDLEIGFSDALSTADWTMRQWEVCGLMFEPDVITHWALARRKRRVATSKARVEFVRITAARVALSELERRMGAQVRRHLVRSRAGVGGRVPPATWNEMKSALAELDPASFETVETLERLRDQGARTVDLPGAPVVVRQRDATGLALNVFDSSHRLRKRTLQSWTPPAQRDRLTSFLDGLPDVRTVESQVIAADVAGFPGATRSQPTAVGTIFHIGDRQLEVFNVNTHSIETTIGVDLLYFNSTFEAWTMVQYKLMEAGDEGRPAVYRPDLQFDQELARMREFRRACPDSWSANDGARDYRLCGDGFYFKLCSRHQLVVLSDSLLPGLYLPRLFAESILVDSSRRGPRGGRVLHDDNTERHITNTTFAELVRDGWIGTRGLSSAEVGKIVRSGLDARHALVLARSRGAGEQASLDATLNDLGLQQS